jgi:hypothetical protein
MQRTRSSGSSGYTGWTAMTTKISRIRKVYGYGAYELQTGLTQNGYQNGLIDDVSSITDVLGARDCFNPCTHTQHSNYEGLSSPKALDRTAEAIAAIAPLAKEATTGWFGCCVELIGGVRKVSPKIFFNNNWPSYSLPTPAWTDMVQEVGEGLAGDMGSKSLILSSLVELGKTLSMLRNPMGLIKLITKTKSWRTLSLADGLKRVSSQWLEYRYGWRPLFSDIEAILSAADKVNDHMQYLQNSVGRLVPVRARRSYSTNVTITTPNQLLFPTYSSCGAKLVGINAVATRDAAFGVNILRGETFRLASRASYLKQHLGVDRLLETGCTLFLLALLSIGLSIYRASWLKVQFLGGVTISARWVIR